MFEIFFWAGGYRVGMTVLAPRHDGGRSFCLGGGATNIFCGLCFSVGFYETLSMGIPPTILKGKCYENPTRSFRRYLCLVC